MRIKITEQDRRNFMSAEVERMSDIPGTVFAYAQHHGSGTYIAHIEGTDDLDGPAFLMTTTWLDGDDTELVG